MCQLNSCFEDCAEKRQWIMEQHPQRITLLLWPGLYKPKVLSSKSQTWWQYVCICVQSFIYSNFMRNDDALYYIQIKCFLTKQQSFCQHIFNWSTHTNTSPENSCFLFYFSTKLAEAKCCFFFPLKPFSYQINKTWHVAQYLQKDLNKTRVIWTFKDKKGNQKCWNCI